MKKKIIFKVSGMHCHSCSDKIKKAMDNMPIEDLDVSYEKGRLTCATESPDEIIKVVNKMGYTAEVIKENQVAVKGYKGLLVGAIIILGLYMMIKNTIGFNQIPSLQEQVTYPILFLLGIVTSLHCLSMCGGIVLSQSIAFKNPIKSSALYNVGRVIAYTVIGGVVGGIGSVISFSPMMKGYITIFAGGFMVLLGLSMLESFSFLKKYVKLPGIFNKVKFREKHNTPLFIGLATGFMPCGPLQTIQLYALGTGSVMQGALSMFVFSIGTVPLMMGLGTVSGLISGGLNRKLLKLSAVLVVILGVTIINRGLILQARDEINPLSTSQQEINIPMLPQIVNGFQFITTHANDSGYQPKFFILEKDRTVKWMINAEEVTECNKKIIIHSLGIEEEIVAGHNLIEFTPKEIGEISFSCWRGIIEGYFIVVEDLNDIPDDIEFLPAATVDCCTR